MSLPKTPIELVDDASRDEVVPTGQNNNHAAPLANRKDPYYYTKQERPAHRVMLELAAKGHDVKEIAAMTGYTAVCVNNILRQPHAQQNLVDTIAQRWNVDDEVVEIIKRNVKYSVKLYEQVLHDSTAPREARMEAAERFLNRRYGKPNQPFSQGSSVDLNSLSDDELVKLLPTVKTVTSQ